MDFSTLGNSVTNAFIFKGSPQKPFLAPRGVFVGGNLLLVSDTGQNRVFGWENLPNEEFQEPDFILGQSDVSEVSRNSGHLATANSLQYPSGIWSDGEKIIVADAWNHRVLIWNSFPKNNAQNADVVIGQPDFTSNLPNVKGIGTSPTSQSLHWCYGVFSDGKSLWIADTGNRRILFYENIPTENFAKADQVIGKPDFETRDYEDYEPIWPYSIDINEKGNLIVADTQFYRNLVWKDKNDAFTKPADFIIGQEKFTDCGQNQFSLNPTEKSLSWTYDAIFYKNGIFVNDTGNSRILWFDEFPTKNNPVAKAVIGKKNFHTGSENSDNLSGTFNTIYWPFSIKIFGEKLVIADTGNHRLIFTDLLI